MELFLALPVFSTLVVLPLAFVAGRMATSSGRKFWPWFFIGMVLPVIASIIIFCIPPIVPEQKKTAEILPVENENLFDHLFIPVINKKTAA